MHCKINQIFKIVCVSVAFNLQLSLFTSTAQQVRSFEPLPRFSAQGYSYSMPETNWVDSVMQSLTLEQRIAQLMVVRVPLDMDDMAAAAFSKKMNGYGVGGVCFFAGTAERQAEMTRLFQADAKVPLLVNIDAEWGLGMRLKDMYSFPRNARFGQLPDYADSIVYRMGEEIGHQCRMMGIHVNYAPVVDINSNPKNPVIGTRSYGVDRERVARLGILFAKGLQSMGVMAVAKHFPGHGDTETDSHLELPVINHTPEYIDTIDLYPFKRMIAAGVGGVMAAHLQVNALDSKRPSSLSPTIISGLLREKLGFNGLIITDGLDMKGVTNTYANGAGELAALQAGNDILLLPPDVEKAIAAIKGAAVKDENLRQQINYHCHRVLEAKYRLVVPTMNDPITVPGDDRRKACEEIVADLNLALDRRIDSIVDAAIAARAMPGCQIVVLHKGRTILNRTYGYLTYDADADTVTTATVYDLASLTKVCATTLSVMKLVDMGKIKIDDRLSKYLPYLKGTDKEKITVKQAMSHCARLKAFDAYWQKASDYDSILNLVAATPLLDKEGMVYSDLGFMLLSDVVRRVSGVPLDRFAEEYFYQPMGLKSTAFHGEDSKLSVPLDRIAPTEADSLRGLIRGSVHDPNAYAMGGVSGHAGLFSTAEEVAALMQMLLDGGVYRGVHYLDSKTIATFTSRHFAKQNNRRALGFDKQLFNPSKSGQVCPEASQASFGHTGFTGTMVWVDPDYDLVYVFLSNRVHPTATPNLLARMNVRTEIQSILYQYLKK